MQDNFSQLTKEIVGPLLADMGFTVNGVDNDIDEGDRRASAVYYRSSDCKIQVYKSSREGNINCMIAPADALNRFGPSDQSSTWRFLNEFSATPDISIEELAKSVSYRAKSQDEQLTEVRDRIRACYDDARAGILQTDG